MSIRNWGWQQWTILIGGILLGILLLVVIYIISQPDAFRPTVEGPTQPGTGLPTTIEGTPDFPASPIESIPLGEIQGLDIPDQPDILATGGETFVFTLTEFPVQYTAIASDGSSINYYDPEENRFYRISQDGNIQEIQDEIFAEVENVAWSPNATDAILEFPDGSNVVYNFDTGEQITLPAHWEDFSFSPNGESIAFKSLPKDERENWLAVSSLDGSTTRRIEHLGAYADTVTIDWSPNNQVVGTQTEADGLSQSKVFFLGFNGENFKLSRVYGHNFEGSWSPDGRNLVYSAAHEDDNFNPRLWVADGAGSTMGQNRKAINLQTWTHKCTYATATTMYCGVPKELPRGAGLIPSVADNVADDIYSVDITTGAVARIAVPADDIQVSAMHYSEEGKSLIIEDSFTGELKALFLE